MRASKTLPFLLLGAACLVILMLVLVRRVPEERERQNSAPLVRVVVAEPVPYQFTVTAHGSVSPRTESDLIPQVSGEVLWISPSLAAGGFFESGDVLVRVDSADYRVDRETARAVVARAESEFGRAKKGRDRQRRLADRSVASEARIDDAENAFRVAEASLLEARARLERANRDLTRTELKAPYRGRVRTKRVDVGQFVTRGAVIATLYAVDYAEVRLPIPDRELAYLDIPLIPERSDPTTTNSDRDSNDNQSGQADKGSPVTLIAEFAGRTHQWHGTLVRTEAELDPRSRMVHLVARVADPYGLASASASASASAKEQADTQADDLPKTQSELIKSAVASEKFEEEEEEAAGSIASLTAERRTPLAVGLFVEAQIEGQSIKRAFVIPRDALRTGDRVYIVDAEDRIQFRDVLVLRTERDNIIISAGLESGERVCTTPLQAAINGMRVRVYEPKTPGSDAESADPARLAEHGDANAEVLQ